MLFVGDDWAEDHHDVEVQDEHGRAMRTARLPEGVDGMTRFHELVARFLPDDADPSQVLVCIETDRGPWVRALIAAGYQVYGVNPKQAARHRELHVDVGCQERQGRRPHPGRHGPDPPPPAASGRRRLRHRRGGQGRGPGASDADLGTHPPHAAATGGATGLLPRRAGGLPGVDADRQPMRWNCWRRHPPRPRRPSSPLTPDQRRVEEGPAAATSPPRPPRSSKPCAPSTWARPRSSPAPTRPRSAPRSRSCRPSTPRSGPWKARSRPILASTRTLRSTSANPASA